MFILSYIYSTILLSVLFTLASTQEDNNCEYLDEECISINDCISMIEMIEESREMVKRKTCGYDGDVPRVCCQGESIPQSQDGGRWLEGHSTTGPSDSACTSPNGKAGICVPIMKCQPIIDLVGKTNRTPEELNFLKESQCEADPIKVCCEEARDERCFNADAKQGVCMDVTSCQAITSLLRPPMSKEILEFVKNSRCEGPSEYSVCCGPNHIENVVPGQCEQSAAPPDKRTKCCGIDASAANKIYGGNDTAIDQYPWLTLIEYKTKFNKIKILCGGALISSKYVLTAGHCVVGTVLNVGKPENVRLGEYDTSNAGPDCVQVAEGVDCTDGILVVPIEKIIPHRGYDPESSLKRNDIALIRMKNLVPYTDFIRPICLPTSDVTLSGENFVFYAAGWGAVSTEKSFSQVKLDVDLPYKSMQECQKAYSVTGRRIELWNRQLCAGGEQGKDTCRGDSGGPLMYDDMITYSIVGVVSFGPSPCGSNNVPGVYTKVYEYIPWIRAMIKP